MFNQYTRFLILSLLFNFTLIGQDVRLNEVVSSNSTFYDEDGDTPDWIELYNYGNKIINLQNWHLSDDSDNLKKWSLPDISINPNNYLLIWSSGKNRKLLYPRTIIKRNDYFKYLIPNIEPDPNWTDLNFNDDNWDYGQSGFGYSDDDDKTVVPDGTISVFLRKKFEIENLDDIHSIFLDIDYDDAFIAYINGIEIARANINGYPPEFNSEDVNSPHEAEIYRGGVPERFVIEDHQTILNEGENILAIQGHNINSQSSDMTVIPFLSAIFKNPSLQGHEPDQILDLESYFQLHTNFKISSNNESIYFTNENGKIVDEILVDGLLPGNSVGYSNLSNEVVNFIRTTPGYRNSSQEFVGTVKEKVSFSHQGGIKDSELNLELSGKKLGQVIRYTRDGSEPNSNSNIYKDKIKIDESTSIRARIYEEGYIPSEVKSESYVIGSNHDIDILLISTDPENLFDDENGIYTFGTPGSYYPNIPFFGANFWEDWEIPGHISFFENGSKRSAKFNTGIKIFGGWSRGQNGQRSLSFFARGKYGDPNFKHKFFDNLEYDDFESFVIRNSGQDWLRSNMKDIMLTSLMRGSEIDFQENNPVATYINGDYWGMYNMREKINEHMLASKHNVSANEITILTNNADVLKGDNNEYNKLINFINNNDLSNSENYEYVSSQIDIDQYTLYQASNIYFNNTDWPGNNIKFWKHPDTKWRWIMYDTDFGFGPWWNLNNYRENTLSFSLEVNGGDWPNPPWSTLLFRKLIMNNSFKNQFINRYADELNTRFKPENVVNHIYEVYSTVEPEIIKHFERWKNDSSVGYNINNIKSHVNHYVNNMVIFARNRHSIARNHIMSQFNIRNFHSVMIENANLNFGYVKINENIDIETDRWTGEYFETIPIKIRAIPKPGFEFSHWSGDLSSKNEIINISLMKDLNIQANFIYTGPLNVYPNPSKDLIYIVEEGVESFDVIIYSISGKIMGELSQVNKIDIRYLPKGIYTLKIKSLSNIFYKKIVRD